ncbi:MAG: 4-(cytidine 5'-diphospho)-2-C-methyl-D-erythritol kinase [Cyclobacteriaceae bacterium]
MITFPNAKINLGLHVLSKRKDGYHEIESCLYPIPVLDALEILPSNHFSFNYSGIDIPGSKSDNLILQAYELLKKDFPNLPPVAVHLHKAIPIGAGLGGGSSDAAFSLKLMNQLFELELDDQELESYAGQVGSDCPFFIQNQPKLVGGRGEQLSSCEVDLMGKWLYLVHPNQHISTKEAYAGVKPKIPVEELRTILSEKELWKNRLVNDFEESVFKIIPKIEEIKRLFYKQGAFYAAMSGSGSAVYGLFDEEPTGIPVESGFFQFCKQLD